MTVAYSAFRPVSAILLACSLIGCGGDTESAAQADDPLATGAGFIALTTTLLGGDAISQKSMGFGALTAPGRKAAVTTPCDSGSMTVDEATGRTEYDSCVTQFTNGGYSLTSTLDGVEISTETDCPDTSSCAANSTFFLDQYGENGQPLVAVNQDSNGVDVRSTALLTDRYSVATSNDTTTYNSLLNGRVTSQDRAAGLPELRFGYNEVRFVEVESPQGYSVAIDGAFNSNAGSIAAGCASGAAMFATTTPVQFDSGGALTAGALTVRLADDTAVTATVENGVFVIRSGGESTTYSLAQLSALCS